MYPVPHQSAMEKFKCLGYYYKSNKNKVYQDGFWLR